ncbi:MAG: cytochrome c oxidase subunit II [Anaerolineae bacterium]
MTTQSTQHGWVDPYERIWIIVGVVMLIVFTTAITIASMAYGIQVPAPERRVDPNTVADSAPFNEPGLRELGGGKYEAYIVGRTWAWDPKEITVPVGSTVTFFITAKDVQHGFMLWDTNLNIQIVPGQVSKLTITFDTPGEYPYICNEYCGVGHHTMAGKVIVE